MTKEKLAGLVVAGKFINVPESSILLRNFSPGSVSKPVITTQFIMTPSWPSTKISELFEKKPFIRLN